MRLLLALLLLLTAGWTADELPAPEETAALLLSPAEANRKKAKEILQTDRGRAYERAVLATIAEWAHDRQTWIDELRRITRERDPIKRSRALRMLDHLRPELQLVSVEVNVIAVPEETAKQVLGPGLATVVSNEAAAWERWRATISQAKGAKVLFSGTAAGDDGEEVTAEANKSISYIRDFELKGGPGKWVADPVVDNLAVVSRATWRPILSADRRFVTVRMALSLTDCIQPIAVEQRDLDGKLKVRVQVPEVSRARTKMTVTLPTSGHAAWSLVDEKGRRLVVLCRAVHSTTPRPR